MPDSEHAYERREIGRALKDHPERHALTMKIAGDENASRWLNITVEQARAIQDVLDPPDTTPHQF